MTRPYPLLFLHHTGHFSGAENSLLHLATHIDHDKFLPIFLCPGNGRFPNLLLKNGIKVIDYEYGKVRQVVPLMRSVKMIRKVARTHQIALFHSNGPQTNLPSGIAGQSIGIPVVWHARNLLKSGMIDVDRMASLLPQKIICNSEAIRSRFIGYQSKKKAVTVVNAVDLNNFKYKTSGESIRTKFGIPPEAVVVGMMSRLGPDKGHSTFLEAVASLKNNNFFVWGLIVGDHVFPEDSWMPLYLSEKARELGISDRIVFTGFQGDVEKFYAAMDIFLLGTDAEPCGRVIFEAMAMAKPVVGTKNGGTPEIVMEGKTGSLYKYGDANELADKLSVLIDNPTLINRMGIAGRRRIQENFTIDKHVEKTQAIYLQLIEGQSANRS